ncbi:MAG TPA: hypothetical protein VFE46_03085 [Pirellulales bacterium]|nr:hypothetical protein [Pirellulales bacterium]
MKSWMLRLAGVVLVGGIGTASVIVAQRRSATQDPPLPDLSQAPVNADTVAAMSGNRSSNDRYPQPVEGGVDEAAPRATEPKASGSHSPVDPFQGLSTSAGDYRSRGNDRRIESGHNNETAANDAVSDQNVVPAGNDETPGKRTAGAEPHRLTVDPGAAPIVPQSSAGRGTLENIPAANEVGPTDRRDATSAAMENGNLHSTIPPAQNGLRYVDSGMRKASGIATPTGTLENVSNDRFNAASATPPVVGNGYNELPPNAGDYRRQPATNDVKTIDPTTIDSSEAALARGIPAGPATENGMPTGGMMDRGLPPAGISGPGATRQGNSAFGNGMPPVGAAGLGNSQFGNGLPPGASGVVVASNNAVNIEGFGKPGDKKLEGAQTPSVTIQKTAPTEIQVGKEATFEIVVRNTGPVQANDVQVTDVVPQGTRLLNTTPRTNIGPRGEIVWPAGDLKPGEEAKLQVQVMPLQEGEIGSTAVVQFRSAASMRTVATKPDLVLELGAPQQVMIGADAKLQIKISNPGTGAANKVMISARIPPNFQHPAGNDLEFEIGQFRPGESRDLDLVLHAVQAGPAMIALVAQGDANLHVEKTTNLEVVAPRLEVKLAGPGMRYLDRQAKYTVTVGNPGTAPARDITLVTHLPKGLQFVEASDSGQYDTSSNSISWALDELPPGQSGNVTVTAVAKEPGDQKLRSEVKATGGLTDASEQVTVVEGVAAVNFTVAHLEDPVEVGGQATYEIHIVNQGSKAANRLQVMAVLPPEIKPVSGEGPSRQAIEGQRIAFEPLARLAPKADVTYRVVGQCLAPGDLRVQVLLQTDDMAKPVVKEEGTRVYKD